MDFHELLSTAKQNISSSKNKDKFYRTSFAPPKKVTKEKKLSDNIKKFLDKKDEEEREKLRLAHEKKRDLLARRDPKIQRKVEKSLKVFKSSKKFYTGDKTLDENTAVTLQNEQPDEDDYGFASSSSDILHQKLMEKYSQLPVENKLSKIFKEKKGKVTKGAEGDEHHFKNGHRERVSTIKGEPSSKSSSKPSSSSSSNSKSSHHLEKKIVEEKPKPKHKPAPPVDFHELLKLAAQKQHEEIMIEVPTKKEPERLLTSKEKRELEELEASRKAKLKPPATSIPKIPKLGAIPKLNESSKNDKTKIRDEKKLNGSSSSSSPSLDRQKLKSTTNSPQPSSSKLRDALIKSEKPSTSKVASKVIANKSKDVKPSMPMKTPLPQKSDRPSTSREVTKTREFPPKDIQRTREFPPRDLQRTREFPPRDLKRPMMGSKKPSRPPMSNKRRMIDDDDDSEYDSEMDDFIDDGDEDVDVSSAIKSIFGYDKSKYRDENFDDREMISDYRTVMKEEYISKKIGIMEDLEDMKREAEELKQKEMRKKQLSKKKKFS